MERPRVHEGVVATLARRVLSGAVSPGALLPSMAVLSEELGVSRPALREAVKVLGAKGMVEVRPRTGIRVRPRDNWNVMDPELLSWCGPELSAELLRNLLQCRLLMEPGAAALAAENATAAQVAAIEETFNRMQAAENLELRVTADLDFHVAVLKASGNLFLVHWSATIASILLAAFRLSTGATTKERRASSAHYDVLDAIRLRNPARADRAMRRLLTVAAKDLHVDKIQNGARGRMRYGARSR
jgi:GntR family transcriptional regulator, galactonate operon transcriptional repressor